ncbi:MAG TPA: hypothetical protein VHG30_14260 [Microvirga sp.]|nr:hypothetical protein [Microvirga sp.]
MLAHLNTQRKELVEPLIAEQRGRVAAIEPSELEAARATDAATG